MKIGKLELNVQNPHAIVAKCILNVEKSVHQGESFPQCDQKGMPQNN